MNLSSSNEQPDVAVIGGGCAGMAAALSAVREGAQSVSIFERSPALGGVLRQCIHNGFGVHRFHEDLTGVEYASRFIDQVGSSPISCHTATTVLGLSRDRVLTSVNAAEGLCSCRAKAVVLATGCRERPRGALLIPGTRPAGVLTAGAAQRYMNLEGVLVGRRIVILGSGDIGLIMARQFVLEGAEVLAVAEVMPYSGGLVRNIVQCLDDFGIPLWYNTTVTAIEGEKRLSAVVLSHVDGRRRPIPGTQQRIECDTLVLSVGLIPENEVAQQAGIPLAAATGGALVDDALQTDVPGIFACGNALHVHDLVDFVTDESERAGRNAALFARAGLGAGTQVQTFTVCDGPGVRGAVPQRIRADGADPVSIQFRPAEKRAKSTVSALCGGQRVHQKQFPVLSPGEMCSITLPRKAICGDITIQVEP